MSSRLWRLSAVAMALSLAACQPADPTSTNTSTTDSPAAQPAGVALPAGVTLVEQQLQANGENIPFQKFKLANGLTVILHEDHSDPLVHVDVTYHVGSAREELGKSGFAHFFEHMMFQGSEHVADEQHFKIITEAGGDMNGSTNSDRTNYYQTVPMNQLEKVLWLESDRMGFLLGAVTEKKFENQRELDKEKLLLQKFATIGSIVYIIRVKTLEHGNYIVKIGESRIGIKNRYSEHKTKYEECVLLDCFSVNRSSDFESFIHNHEKIRLNKITNLKNHENEMELFLIGKNLGKILINKRINNSL